MTKKSICLAMSITAALAAAPLARGDAPAAGGYAMTKTLKLGGAGRWDYATFAPESGLLYLTRSTHMEVVDPASGKVVADVAPMGGSHGTAVAPKAGRGFVSDGEGAAIVVFDLKTNAVLGKVAAADDADGIVYDAGSDRVLCACGDAGKLIVLDPGADPKSAKADAVDLGGKPEFLAADGKGMAYVNINDKNQVAVVDLKALKVTARWPIGTGTSPAGLAIDPAKGVLFVGCHNNKVIVLSTDGGKVLGEVPIGKGNDACAFDPGTGEAFASCADGTMTVVKETSPGKFEATQTVATKAGARTVALDPASHTLYLPTADFEAAPSGGGKRPAMKPDTFQVVVVAPTAK